MSSWASSFWCSLSFPVTDGLVLKCIKVTLSWLTVCGYAAVLFSGIHTLIYGIRLLLLFPLLLLIAKLMFEKWQLDGRSLHVRIPTLIFGKLYFSGNLLLFFTDDVRQRQRGFICCECLTHSYVHQKACMRGWKRVKLPTATYPIREIQCFLSILVYNAGVLSDGRLWLSCCLVT